MPTGRSKDRPTDELLERVRFIVTFRARYAPSKRDALAEPNPLGSHLYTHLMSMLEGRGLAVLYRKRKGLFDKQEKLHHRVMEGRTLRLDFADRLTIGAIDGPRELASIGKYSRGGWEEALKEAYDECLRLTVEADKISALEDQLANAESPEAVVSLLDGCEDREGTLKMLCLTPKRNSNAFTLYMSHIMAERVADAHAIIETALEASPDDARLHLILGNFYWAALCNARGWPEGKEPGFLRMVTLEALDMPYEKARSLARTHYLEAMRLSTHREVEDEASTQLSTLRS